jgi:hypothetical protein
VRFEAVGSAVGSGRLSRSQHWPPRLNQPGRDLRRPAVAFAPEVTAAGLVTLEGSVWADGILRAVHLGNFRYPPPGGSRPDHSIRLAYQGEKGFRSLMTPPTLMTFSSH